MKRDELDSQVLLEIFRAEIRWYHFVTPEARNIVTDRVRTDAVRRLAEAGRVDIGTADPGSYSVPSLINREGGPWTRHGHAIEGVTVVGSGRPDGIARCGGPALCSQCREDERRIRAEGPGSTSPEPGPEPLAQAPTLTQILEYFHPGMAVTREPGPDGLDLA